jgi:tetratricopeptide (TPR) repeat protein
VGRTALLATLRIQLCDESPRRFSHCVALCGMGGVGKTQIAIEYLVTYTESYSHVFWISAASESQVVSGFENMARLLGVDIPEPADPDKLRTNVLTWLNREPNWLLVFDNLDEIQIVSPYLPRRVGSGHVLITSRDPNARDIPAQAVQVDIFDEDEAYQLLVLRADLNEDPPGDARAESIKIVTELGFLAIGVEQAAAYIRVQLDANVFKFLEIYHRRRKEILAKRLTNWEYPESVATTWSLSFECVQNSNPNAALCLNLFAFLNSDGIIERFLEEGVVRLKGKTRSLQLLKSILDDSFLFHEALSDLAKFSLISRRQEIIRIHRLVQAVLQDNMNPKELSSYLSMVVELIWAALPESKEENRQKSWYFESQIAKPLLSIIETGYGTEKLADVLQIVALILNEEHKYTDAELLLVRAFDICSENPGAYRFKALGVMKNLAHVFEKRGKLPRSLVLLEKAFNCSTRIMGENHECTLDIMISIARCSRKLQQPKQALELDIKVWNVRRSTIGENHPETLAVMGYIAGDHRDLGWNQKAIEIGEQVLEVLRNSVGPEHLNTLHAMLQLVYTYYKSGRFDEAISVGTKLVEASQRLFGEDDFLTLKSMHDLAAVYHAASRAMDAIPLFEKVLEIETRTLGEHHPSTLMTKVNLSWQFVSIGQIDEAFDRLNATLDTARSALGEDHTVTLTCLGFLAEILRQRGDDVLSVRILEKVSEAQVRTMGEHFSTLEALTRLANGYAQLNRWTDAVAVQSKILAHYAERTGDLSSQTVSSRAQMGWYCLRAGILPEAEAHFSKVLELHRRSQNQDNSTMTCMYGLSHVYNHMGRRDAAIQIVDAMLEMIPTVYSQDDQGAAAMLTKIVVFCKQAGYLDKVDEADLRLQEIESKVANTEHG